jgi:hypothetical protein
MTGYRIGRRVDPVKTLGLLGVRCGDAVKGYDKHHGTEAR